jgi:hypothetical protein
LFFVRVNQVLVRLWARAMGSGRFGWGLSRCPVRCLTGRALRWKGAPRAGGERSEACVKNGSGDGSLAWLRERLGGWSVGPDPV